MACFSVEVQKPLSFAGASGLFSSPSLQYSLIKDVVSSLKRHRMHEQQFTHHPLLVLNNFGLQGLHIKVMATMFQNMFPSINVHRVSVGTSLGWLEVYLIALSLGCLMCLSALPCFSKKNACMCHATRDTESIPFILMK